jgi:hypothetical protein
MLLRIAAVSRINRSSDLGERFMKVFVRAAFAASMLLAAQPALAGSDLDPASAKALHDYTLSMDKINAMQAATDEGKANAALMKSLKSVGDDSKSIAEMEAKLSANAPAMALYRKHGLSAHDVVVMPFVLMDAGMAVQYPSSAGALADRMSPAQMAFYKQHQAELKKQRWMFGQ